MDNNTQIEFTKSGKYRVQKVKNYDAAEIPDKGNTPHLHSSASGFDTKSAHRKEVGEFAGIKQQNVEKDQKNIKDQPTGKTQPKRKSRHNQIASGKQTVWQKIVCYVTYFFGITSVLYFLANAWYFLGMASIAVSLLVFLLSKTKSVKEESGKVFFVTLCGTVVSALFWVLYLTTRRYGIGFLSTLFRALQMAGAFLSAALVAYYYVEYVTHGKVKIAWLSSITEKTQEKLSHIKSN